MKHGAARLEHSATRAVLRRAGAHTLADTNGEAARQRSPLSTRYDALESLYLSAASPPFLARRSPLLDTYDRSLSGPSPLQYRSITTSAPLRFSATSIIHEDHQSGTVEESKSARTEVHPDNVEPIAQRPYDDALGPELQGSAQGAPNVPKRKSEVPYKEALEPEGYKFTALSRHELRRTFGGPTLNNLRALTSGRMHKSHRNSVLVQGVMFLYEGLSVMDKLHTQTAAIKYLVKRFQFDENIARLCSPLAVHLYPKEPRESVTLFSVRCNLEIDKAAALEQLKENLRRDVAAKILKLILRASFAKGDWSLLRDACYIWFTKNRKFPQLGGVVSVAESRNVIKPFWLELQNHISQTAGHGDAQGDEPAESQIRLAKRDPATVRVPNVTHPLDDLEPGAARQSRLSVVTVSSLPRAQLDRVSSAIAGLLVEVTQRAVAPPANPENTLVYLHTIRSPELYIEFVKRMATKVTKERLRWLFVGFRDKLGRGLHHRLVPTEFECYKVLDPDRLLMIHENFCNHYYAQEAAPQDSNALRDWWTRYGVRGALLEWVQDIDAPSPYVEVFKRHGDDDMVQFATRELRKRRETRQKHELWREELSTYVKEGDYAGALELWRPRFDSDEPDVYTLTTLMNLSADYGDVAFTLGLFDKAKEWKVNLKPQIIIPVLKAFGTNGSLNEARRIFGWALDNNLRSTEVCNTMLGLYASSNHLHHFQRLMDLMTEKKIPQDHQTYLHLLEVLTHCGQGHEAYRLLKGAITINFKGLTTDHFETILAGIITVRDYRLVFKFAKRMKAENVPMTLNILSLLVKAGHRWEVSSDPDRPRPDSIPDVVPTTKDLVNMYRKTRESDIAEARRFEKESSMPNTPPMDPPKQQSRDPLIVKRVALSIAEAGDFEGLRTMASIYLQKYDQPATLHEGIYEKFLPTGMITGFMRLAFQRGDDARVRYLWQANLDRQRELTPKRPKDAATSRTAPKAHPKKQYSLDESYRVLIATMVRQGDAEGVLQTLTDLDGAGYQLSQATWNDAIRALGLLRKWKEAFSYCERILMPNWLGWKHMRTFKLLRTRWQAIEFHWTGVSREEMDAMEGRHAEQELHELEQYEDSEEVDESRHVSEEERLREMEVIRDLEDAVMEPVEASQVDLAEAASGPPPTQAELEKMERDAEKERQFLEDLQLVRPILLREFVRRHRKRRQRERKRLGTSIKLATNFLYVGKNQRHLRPDSQTLRLLGDGYYEMKEGGGEWAEDLYKWLNMTCPSTVHAIITLIYARELDSPFDPAEARPPAPFSDEEQRAIKNVLTTLRRRRQRAWHDVHRVNKATREAEWRRSRIKIGDVWVVKESAKKKKEATAPATWGGAEGREGEEDAEWEDVPAEEAEVEAPAEGEGEGEDAAQRAPLSPTEEFWLRRGFDAPAEEPPAEEKAEEKEEGAEEEDEEEAGPAFKPRAPKSRIAKVRAGQRAWEKLMEAEKKAEREAYAARPSVAKQTKSKGRRRR